MIVFIEFYHVQTIGSDKTVNQSYPLNISTQQSNFDARKLMSSLIQQLANKTFELLTLSERKEN
jgi:hypothetical protein